MLDKMAALDHLAPLEPEDSLVSWDSLDLRVLLWVHETLFQFETNYTIKCEYSHCIAKMQTVTPW